jgi:sugar diacid utilization regulator
VPSSRETLVRQEEDSRLAFVDDLLRGDADLADMVQRAEPFGIDLSATHRVVLAARRDGSPATPMDAGHLARAVVERYGDRDTLVTHRSGRLVALLPAAGAGDPSPDEDEPVRVLHAALLRSSPAVAWRLAAGRPAPGLGGVAHSFHQAREAVTLLEQLHPDRDWVPTRDLLVYRVLGRDRAALSDLVESVLTPLTGARGGAGPLLDTLEAYFDCNEVATATARRLHVSVRTVTYRLSRVARLTGYDPTDPSQRLTLQVAVVGARLLPWPTG